MYNRRYVFKLWNGSNTCKSFIELTPAFCVEFEIEQFLNAIFFLICSVFPSFTRSCLKGFRSQ